MTVTLQVTTTVSGSAVTWASSNKAVATVDDNGVVTAVSGGAVTITATMDEYSDSVDFKVVEKTAAPTPTPTPVPTPPVSGDGTGDNTGTTTETIKFAELETTKFSIEEFSCVLATTEELDVTKYMAVSSDTSVATVFQTSMGVEVTFVAPGKATIMLTLQENGRPIDSVEIEITAPEEEFPPVEDEPTEPEEPVAPEGGILCTPDETNLVEFKNVDFSSLVGKKVNITVDVIRVGGTENPLAHGQFNDSVKAGQEDWFYAIHYKKEIGDTWTSFGATNFVVPQQFADETNPVYFAIKVADGVDYSQYMIYYKNFNVEVVEEDESKEFYLAENVAFNKNVVNDSQGRVTITQDCYLNNYPAGEGYEAGNGFVNLLPQDLKQDSDYVQKFTTLSGIMDVVDYFEFSVTLENATKKEDGAEYHPQAHLLVQGEGCEKCLETNSYCTCATYSTHYYSTGVPEDAPVTIVKQVYTNEFAEWNSSTILKVAIEIDGAQEGTELVGAYSIKAVLK